MSDEKSVSSEDIYNSAIQILSRREHSVSELRQKLLRKFGSYATENMVDEVLIRLKEHGYVSDSRFAESYIRSRSAKGFGPDRISMELHNKGVDAEVTENTLAMFDDYWQDSIDKVWRKKFKSGPVDYVSKMKQQSFLHYRGFSSALISQFFEDLAKDDE